MNFQDLDLNPRILKAIEEMGFETPTPIQTLAIPKATEGYDVIGQAQTGTGKTAAFAIPMLERIDPKAGLQGLVLSPTRELAVQIAQEINRLAVYLKVGVLPIYGGQSIEHQFRGLRNRPEIVVGTPGRILDHISRRTLDLSNIQYLVLDEADEMLDMGFLEDINLILEKCPSERQTMLFSATIPKEIRDLASKFMKDPVTVKVEGAGVTVPQISQWYHEVNNHQKTEALCRIMDVENPQPGIIFCRTKKGADELAKELTERGYLCEALHGDLSQRERDYSMNRLRQGLIELLVATDVAARGLDISDVTHVINFDIPQDADTYVHRIGRTGRAGKEGSAITMVTPREVKQLRFIEKSIKTKIPRKEIPTLADAKERRHVLMVRRVKDAMEGTMVEYRELASSLLDEYDSTTLLAAALSLMEGEERPLTETEFEASRDLKIGVRLPIGKKQGYDVKKVIKYVMTTYKLTFDDIGRIKLGESFSVVELPEYIAAEVGDIPKKPRRDFREKDPLYKKTSQKPRKKRDNRSF